MSHFSRKPAGPFAWNASPLWRFSCCVFFSSRCNRWHRHPQMVAFMPLGLPHYDILLGHFFRNEWDFHGFSTLSVDVFFRWIPKSASRRTGFIAAFGMSFADPQGGFPCVFSVARHPKSSPHLYLLDDRGPLPSLARDPWLRSVGLRDTGGVLHGHGKWDLAIGTIGTSGCDVWLCGTHLLFGMKQIFSGAKAMSLSICSLGTILSHVNNVVVVAVDHVSTLQPGQIFFYASGVGMLICIAAAWIRKELLEDVGWGFPGRTCFGCYLFKTKRTHACT